MGLTSAIRRPTSASDYILLAGDEERVRSPPAMKDHLAHLERLGVEAIED
jgi:hypothetical protein